MNLTKLVYRFPNEEVIKKIGRFERIADPKLFEGFIVSDFYGKQFYGFIEDETKDEPFVIQHPPTQIDYTSYIETTTELINQFHEQDIEKTVFSRVEKVPLAEADFEHFFERLNERYPQAFCYWFDSPTLGRWMAATPELLINTRHENGKTVALAGTKHNKNYTTWTEKEEYEQWLVTEFIKNLLEKFATSFYVSSRTELVAGPVTHLINHIDFVIPTDKQWDFISELHPTPAVCGTPRETALKLIAKFEKHNRRLYGGIIGENYRERKKMFVNLRLSQWIDEHLYIYVGGGLTKESIPENEWTETVKKSLTFLELINN